jgi:hypothetical protein
MARDGAAMGTPAENMNQSAIRRFMFSAGVPIAAGLLRKPAPSPAPLGGFASLR